MESTLFNLRYTAILTAAVQSSCFIVSYVTQKDTITDFTGTMNFVLNAAMTYYLNNNRGYRQLAVTVLVSMWGLRLGTFLLRRVLVTGKDDRLDKFRNSLVKLGGFWTMQAIWVWVVSLPATLINGEPSIVSMLGPVDVGLIYGALLGLVVENVADQQKYEQRINRKDPRDFMKTGLWAYSRHPNYFGEMTMWWCVFGLAYRQIQSPWMAGLASLSPVLTMVLLLHVSGLPFSEVPGARRQHQLGNLEAYEAWRKATSPIVPMPSSVWTTLPSGVQWLLGEFKRWRYTPKQE
jgi:steroid 5-alpha reductase family enzyme